MHAPGGPDPGREAQDPRWAAGQLVVGEDGRVLEDRSRRPVATDKLATAHTRPSGPGAECRGQAVKELTLL